MIIRIAVAALCLLASVPALAQTEQQCKKLAAVRDGPMFAEWDQTQSKLTAYRRGYQALQGAHADVTKARSDNQVATLFGTFAHVAQISTDLIQNVAAVPKLKFLEKGAYAVMQQLKDAGSVASARDEGEVAAAVAEIAAQANVVTRGFVAINDLVQDSRSLATSLENAQDIERQLSGNLASLDRDMHKLDAAVSRLSAAMNSLRAAKDEIDRQCGTRSTAVRRPAGEPSSQPVSTAGSSCDEIMRRMASQGGTLDSNDGDRMVRQMESICGGDLEACAARLQQCMGQ